MGRRLNLVATMSLSSGNRVAEVLSPGQNALDRFSSGLQNPKLNRAQEVARTDDLTEDDVRDL